MYIIQKTTSQLKWRSIVDLVFCFDCTGSMTEIITGVKDNVNKLIEGFKSAENLLVDWRARVMGYRDFEIDEEYLINDKPFVSSEEALKEQIASLEAKDYTGGDEPESTIDAIWYAAKKTEWRANALRIVVVFTDETTKPINEKTLADIPGATPDMLVLAQELDALRIKLFLWGKTDPLYNELLWVPRADIVQFDNPAEYVKTMSFDKIMKRIGQSTERPLFMDII